MTRLKNKGLYLWFISFNILPLCSPCAHAFTNFWVFEALYDMYRKLLHKYIYDYDYYFLTP